MKKLLIFGVGVLLGVQGYAQPIPPPAATQAEVNAGIIRTKYVSPATLSNWTGGASSGTVTNLSGTNGITVTAGDPIVIGADTNVIASVAAQLAAQQAATNYANSLYDYSVNLGGITGFVDKHNNRQLRKVVVIGDSIANPNGTSLSGAYFLRSITRDGQAGAGLQNRDNLLLKNPSPLATEQFMGSFYGTWWVITNGGFVTWSNATPGGMLCNQVGTWWETTNAENAQLLLQVSTNGGTFATIAALNASNSVPLVRYTNFNLSLTNYRVRVVVTNAPVLSVFGVETINTNFPGAVSYQLDAAGYNAGNLLTGIVNVSNVVALIQPDLVWIQFKDRGDVTDTALSNNMATAYAALNVASGGKLLVSGAYFRDTDVSSPDTSLFETRADSWAAQTYGWAFFDSTYHTKSYSNQVNQGWMLDTVHFNATGGDELGRVLQSKIGLSFTPTNYVGTHIGLGSGLYGVEATNSARLGGNAAGNFITNNHALVVSLSSNLSVSGLEVLNNATVSGNLDVGNLAIAEIGYFPSGLSNTPLNPSALTGSGTVPQSAIPATVVTNNFTGDLVGAIYSTFRTGLNGFSETNFWGNGSGLNNLGGNGVNFTNLNASELRTGTVPNAALPNVQAVFYQSGRSALSAEATNLIASSFVLSNAGVYRFTSGLHSYKFGMSSAAYTNFFKISVTNIPSDLFVNYSLQTAPSSSTFDTTLPVFPPVYFTNSGTTNIVGLLGWSSVTPSGGTNAVDNGWLQVEFLHP